MRNCKFLFLFLFSLSIVLVSCDDETDDIIDPCAGVTCGVDEVCEDGTCISTINLVVLKTAEDIPADVAMAGDTTFFSLESGLIIASASKTSTNWDVAFKGTSIFLNGGTSGTGTVEAQLLTSSIFNEVITAPTSGYVTDDILGAGLAIPTGSGNGWYSYLGPPTHIIAPIGGVVIVLKTAQGNYAKMQIVSYFQGNPDLSVYTVSPPTEPSRYYTINYAVQTDGTTSLK